MHPREFPVLVLFLSRGKPEPPSIRLAPAQRAAAMKDGWGWGVNNGDIWIVLGAVQALRGRLDEAEATLALAHGRSADHPWTKANQLAVRGLRGAAGDAELLRARRAALATETASWCRQVLAHATPNPRVGPLARNRAPRTT